MPQAMLAGRRRSTLPIGRLVLISALAAGHTAYAAEPAKPAAQAPQPVADAPAPNSPDEPLAQQLSLAKAAEFLDQASLRWTTERKCGTCHTNYAYMMARPSLAQVSEPLPQIRKFFEDRAAHWETAKPRWPTEVVATAAALAFNDSVTTGRLHPLSRKALDWMWTVQKEDGSWDWLKCDWPPQEADDYYGVCIAALGTGVAPDGYAETSAAKAGLAKIRTYFQTHQPPSLHHEAMLAWASLRVEGLMTQAQRDAAAARLLALQRDDGGWNLSSLGDWKRRDGKPNDKLASPSDGYGTGFVIYLARQLATPADHPQLQRGVAWLKTHQRASGRWFTRSLTNDKYHFITHAGTAYAVMALHECSSVKVAAKD